MLQVLIDKDPQLAAELRSFGVDVAENIQQKGTASELYRNMALMHDTNTFGVIRHMIREFRKQTNALGFPRKIVFAAHKPINIVILDVVRHTAHAQLTRVLTGALVPPLPRYSSRLSRDC